ncbi:MAG: hypothetical protein Q4G67_08070 [Actinomycetia bacterium]|nr:hypothetical protein [Actinomycetes bacterium]
MSMTVLPTLASAVTAAEGHELPMPAWVFGLIAFALLMSALAATFAFRGTAQKWAHEGDDEVHPFHGTHPGAHHD